MGELEVNQARDPVLMYVELFNQRARQKPGNLTVGSPEERVWSSSINLALDAIDQAGFRREHPPIRSRDGRELQGFESIVLAPTGAVAQSLDNAVVVISNQLRNLPETQRMELRSAFRAAMQSPGRQFDNERNAGGTWVAMRIMADAGLADAAPTLVDVLRRVPGYVPPETERVENRRVDPQIVLEAEGDKVTVPNLPFQAIGRRDGQVV